MHSVLYALCTLCTLYSRNNSLPKTHSSSTRTHEFGSYAVHVLTTIFNHRHGHGPWHVDKMRLVAARAIDRTKKAGRNPLQPDIGRPELSSILPCPRGQRFGDATS